MISVCSFGFWLEVVVLLVMMICVLCVLRWILLSVMVWWVCLFGS